MLIAQLEPRGGDGSAVCARGGDTSSRRWLHSWPRTSTTYQHHSARGPRTARTGRGARDELHGYAPEDAPRQAAGAQHFAMDAGEGGEAPAAGRPAPLLEVLPQERVQQRTVEQIVDPAPLVPLLDDVVPQMVEQLVDIFSPLDLHVAEQVIEVPKIVFPPRAAHTVLGAPQTVDQLVEVPTIISYSSLLQQTMEQNVAIPVRGRGGRNVNLQGFPPRQSSTAPCFLLERISAQIVEQTVDIPGGGLQDFRPGQSSSSVAHSPAAWLNTDDEPFKGVFRTSGRKNATDTRHMGARVPRHVISSTSSAYGPRTWVDDDTGETWTLLTDPARCWWWWTSLCPCRDVGSLAVLGPGGHARYCASPSAQSLR